MNSGGSDTNSNDGNSLYGILFSMRGDELLGGDSDNKPIISDTSGGAGHSRVCMRGVFSREPDTEQIF
jgi:hypothetical protein